MGELQHVAQPGAVGLGPYLMQLATRPAWRWSGRVVEANGLTVEAEGPLCSVGECCEIVDGEGERHLAEVIGFRGRHVLAMPLKATQGIRYGDAVLAMGVTPGIAVGTEMEGRIVDALGSPLDGLPAPRVAGTWPLDGTVPHPMEREVIREPLQTGLRVLDGMLTVGRGQRVGVFGGSGVGKSTLIGMMTRNTAADLTVVGLVGERGREVREFVEDSLGEEGRKRSVVLVSTSARALCCECGRRWRRRRSRSFMRRAENTFCWCWIHLRDTRWPRARLDWRRVSPRRVKDIHHRYLRGWRNW